jgi:hypothetical protein
MIAEVSGLADLLFVFSKFLMATFFTIRLLKSHLVYQIGQVTLSKDDDDKPPDLEKEHLLQRAAKEIRNRFRLKLNLWQTLVAYFLPRRFRSE